MPDLLSAKIGLAVFSFKLFNILLCWGIFLAYFTEQNWLCILLEAVRNTCWNIFFLFQDNWKSFLTLNEIEMEYFGFSVCHFHFYIFRYIGTWLLGKFKICWFLGDKWKILLEIDQIILVACYDHLTKSWNAGMVICGHLKYFYS